MSVVLHGYFRSSAAWRVRIALRLKGVSFGNVFHHLRRNEQNAPGYLALNPQGLVPTLDLGDGRRLTQSLAICEYLNALHPEPPLLPEDPFECARVRAFAQAIACDTHPIHNLKIFNRLRAQGMDESAIGAWARFAIDEGLRVCADLIDAAGPGEFCFGDRPTLADICLIPQFGGARRFDVELRWPRLLEIEARCMQLPAFRESVPALQPDADQAAGHNVQLNYPDADLVFVLRCSPAPPSGSQSSGNRRKQARRHPARSVKPSHALI